MAIQLEDLVARLRLDSSGVATGLSSVDSKLGSVGDKATAAGKKLTLGVTTPLVGIGIASTNLAATFDKTMRQVSIATGGPADALSDLAKQMGAETAFSANEAADAMLELAKGGMTAAQIEGGALAATMKLASAGGVALADASTYVSNSMAAFGLKAKDADSITVALAGAANASSASVESLGMGLSQAAASAVNAGLSLQETTGVLSYFDSVGLKGSDAGTSLKSMFNSLIPTTEAAAGAMADANLNFVDAEGNFVSVANMAEQLKRGLGDMTEAQRASTLETIFGSDGMRAASALMRGGAEAVRDYTKASKDQETTTKLANAAMEGTAGAMERAQGSIETAGLAVGEVLAPYVEKAAAKVEELANAFSSASPATQEMIVKGAALAAVVGPLTIGVGVLASSLGKIISVSTTIVGGLSRMTSSMGDAEKGGSRLAATAKRAAGIGGMIALADGLQRAHKEGSTFGSVMESAAGGAGIGAMFGPIGALVGAAGGAGLSLLAGSFAETAEEAEAARIEMMKTEGFKNAKADADTLAEALQGVSNAYGKVARQAVEQSFTGADGKLDADIQKLRDLGVSMDTIVSATMGRANAQRIVDRALTEGIAKEEQRAAVSKRALTEAEADYAKAAAASQNYTSTTKRQGQSIEDASDALDKARANYEAAKKPLSELGALQETFGERVRRNTGEIASHRRQVQQLADDLGITVAQYRRMPADVRTRIEANGLPQTIQDTLRLIGEYDELQNFRSIKALIEATNAPLTINQIETLKKRYDLTPKQVKTLIAAVGVEAEGAKVSGYKGRLDSIPRSVTTTVHTQYTYSGLKDPTRGRDGRAVAPKMNTQQDDGYDYGEDFGDGFVNGLLSKTTASAEAGDKVSDAAKAAAKARQREIEQVGNVLSNAFGDGIAGGREQVVTKMNNLLEALEDVASKAATRVAENARKVLKPLGKQYDGLATDLAAAQAKLTQLEAARQVVEDRQAALGMAGGDLGALTFGEDADGVALSATSDRVIGALTAVRDAATNFDTTLVALKNAGLSQDAIDQLIAKGPEAAAATAQAILAGGPEAIAQINSLQQQIAASGLSIQAKSSQTMHDVGVAAQQGLITGLESQMEALEGQMNKIAKRMVRAIRKALKIKSPSRVMDELGAYTGEGFANGLDSTASAVARAAERVSSAALVTPPTITPPSFVDPTTNVGSIARSSLRSASPTFAPEVRVFIGDRELTDIVDVQIGSTLAPLRTYVRQGA